MTFRRGFWALILSGLLWVPAACRDPGRDAKADGGGGGGGGGVSERFDITTCERTLEPPAAGECRTTAGSGSAVIIRGNIIGSNDGYEHGELVYDGDQILCTGCDCSDAAGYDEATVIECADAAISAGLINPHDHLRYTEGAPIDTGMQRYLHRHGWRGSLPTPQNPHGTSATSGGMRWGEVRMLFGGATAIVGSGGADGLLRNYDVLDAEDRAAGLRQAEYETFSLGDSGEDFKANCTWDYRWRTDEVATMPSFLPHIAEGIDDYASEEFFCQSRSDSGARDYTEPNTAHIHAIGLQAEDYLQMAADRAQIIWSPRSNISLYGHTAQVTTFKRFGGIIALGTDWTYSGSANVLRELACADQYNRNNLAGFFSDKQLHDMATINAAIATGNGARVGSLETGKLADIAVFAASGPGQFHRSVLDASNLDVLLVVRGGTPLYGQETLMSALGQSCDAVTVCGESRSICSTREFGITFAQLESQVRPGGGTGDDDAYQAIFCEDIPVGEPTCTPSRPAEFNGAPVPGDADGDGISDGEDNCPELFNPIRPIDGGEQPDADDDGIGDPCDDDPLIADIDGDGEPNGDDNCPLDANSDQADGDSDGRGDACDSCPSLANPDSGCGGGEAMTVTIEDVQNGTVSEDTQVSIEGVVVTGVSATDVTVQDPGASSPEYSGIMVYIGGDPGVDVGDVVDVQGRVVEFFGNTQLSNASVTSTGGSMTIAPTSVSVAEAASEPYENVLVTIPAGGTIDESYDCKQDDSGCSDTNLWSVSSGGDEIVLYDHFYQDGDWGDQTGKTPVTGVTMFRRKSWRLMPRSAADF